MIFGERNCTYFDEEDLYISWIYETEMKLSLPLFERIERKIDLTPSDGMQKEDCLWNGVIVDDLSSSVLVIGCMHRGAISTK